EHSEEDLLAATTARAVEAASQSARAPRHTASDVAVPVEEPVTAGADGQTPNMFQATEGRWGSREVEIVDVALLDGAGQPSFVFHTGEPVAIRLRVHAYHAVDDFVFGVGLFNADGVCCYGTNTYLEEMKPVRLSGGAEAVFAVESLELVEGTYKLDV